ncbi:MAG: DUF1653 domain-containing protein [Clostridia bacterium]|nr:DUF1653 domain-containing protein [Clostridia bacterium]
MANADIKNEHCKASEVVPGFYRHFKGGLYEVLFTARHSETEEILVIYRSVERGDCWARPISMWNETVERDSKSFVRFQYIGSSMGDDANR